VPLIPKGIGRSLYERVKERLKHELGLEPAERPPARTAQEVLMRIHEAASQRPPKMVRALYKAKDADVATWRHLQPYSLRMRAKDDPGTPLIYAACEKDQWKVEAFIPARFEDVQVTNIPFTPRYKVEFEPGPLDVERALWHAWR
jgi:hypothetical protein